MSFVDNSVKRYNASANLSTQIFSWLKAGAQVNYSQKDYDGQNMWGRGGYTYFWRWGSYFGPYGYRKYDGDGKYYDAQPIADRKQSGEHEDIARNTRLQGWMEANPIKGLNIHADFTYDMTDINVRKSYLPIYGWNNWSNSSTAPSYLVQQKDTYAQQENTRQNVWTVNAYATYDFDVLRTTTSRLWSADRQTASITTTSLLARMSFLTMTNLILAWQLVVPTVQA